MTTLREAAQQALEFAADIVRGKYKGNAEEIRDALSAALEQPERAQAMRDAGYTRRPTLREMADPEQPEQPEQEPVAWQVHPFDYGIGHEGVYAMTQRLDQVKAWERKGWTVQPLYTHPPRREWRGLTEEEMEDVWMRAPQSPSMRECLQKFARAIEAALKERNA